MREKTVTKHNLKTFVWKRVKIISLKNNSLKFKNLKIIKKKKP